MTKRLRLGFVGGGLNSAVGRTHRVASEMDGRWEVVAGAFSRHGDINRRTADAWGVDPTRVYDTWEKLLVAEAGELDAIAVLTPTPQHEEQVSALLEVGVHVISEKALAGSSEAAERLGSLAAANDRHLAVTFNYSGYPMVRELREMVRSGALGRVVALHVEMPQEGFLRVGADGSHIQPQEWRRHDALVPTVSLDLGAHAHHLTRFILETEPSELVAVQSHHGMVATVADYVNCMAKYPNDVDVSIWFGKCALGNRNGLRLRVYGDEAAAEWLQTSPEEIRLSSAAGEIRIVDRASPGIRVANQTRYERFKAGHPAGFLEAFANLYWDMGDVVDGWPSTSPDGGEYVFGADHAAAGLRMLEAMQESARSHSWVRFS